MSAQEVADRLAGPLEAWIVYCESPFYVSARLCWTPETAANIVSEFTSSTRDEWLNNPELAEWLTEQQKRVAEGRLTYAQKFVDDGRYWTFYLKRRKIE